MTEPYDTINKITEMYALSEIPASEDGLHVAGFKGFVVPPSYVNSYNRAALSVRGRVTVAPEDMFALFGGVSSIDDSGISIFGPHETKEKALKRLAAWREKIDEWHPFMPPTIKELQEWGQHWKVVIQLW